MGALMVTTTICTWNHCVHLYIVSLRHQWKFICQYLLRFIRRNCFELYWPVFDILLDKVLFDRDSHISFHPVIRLIVVVLYTMPVVTQYSVHPLYSATLRKLYIQNRIWLIARILFLWWFLYKCKWVETTAIFFSLCSPECMFIVLRLISIFWGIFPCMSYHNN
jgi:hypothetical protein